MKKSLISLAVAGSLTILSGCGGGDSSSGGDAAPNVASYSGTVNKGIVSNGKVEICDVFDVDGCNAESSDYYQETMTNEDGSYDVTDAPTDTPLLVLVSKSDTETTTMKCDLVSCDDGGAAFGDSFEVPDGWSLQAIVPAAGTGTTTVNVTSLTDIAADEAIEVADGNPVTEAMATNANQAVQQAFGLTHDITEIGALDLTDATAVAAALADDSEEIVAATYSATLLDASDEDKADIITFDTSTGGYSVDNDPAEEGGVVLSLLADAVTLLDTVETHTNTNLVDENPDAATVNLASTQDDIEAVVVPGDVDAVDESTELVAAKAFIADVRTAYNAVQDGGDLQTGLEDFSSELDGIDELVSEDVDIIAENLSMAVEAIVEAFEDAEDGSASYEAINGYTVSISNDTYSVAEENVAVSATVTTFDVVDTESDNGSCEDGDFEEPGNTCSEEGQVTANIVLSLDSAVVSSGDTILTADGSAEVSGFISDWTWSETTLNVENGWGWSSTESEELSVESVLLNLDAELTYASNTSFSGDITFEFNGVEVSFDEDETYQNGGSTGESSDAAIGSENFTASEVSVVFNGDIMANEETLGVYFSLMLDNSLGYEHEYTFNDAWSYSTSEGSSEQNSDTETEETASSFVKVHAIARVTTELLDADNMAMTSSIELNASRNEYDVVDTTLTIDYNEIDIILEADLGLYGNSHSDLTVRNTTGAIATINAFDEDADELAGMLSVNNVETASIEETDDGLVLIRYTNGTFESLF